MPTAALTTFKKVAFTVLCCAVLMVFTASAQTIQSVKADPGTNNPPPAGPIYDLGGTYATPPTSAQLIPGGGNETYQQYTVNFTASASNTTCGDGGCSTVITFAFRDDPAQISFTYASVTDVTNPDEPGPNLLSNGNFATGGLTPWTYSNSFGPTVGGYVTTNPGACYTLAGVAPYCWFDGIVQGYDAISQSIPVNLGDQYQISFYVAEDSAIFATNTIGEEGSPYYGDFPANYPGSNCWLAAQDEGPACTFSDLSTNGDIADGGGNGINVTVYAQSGIPTAATAATEETLTIAGAGSGSGTVADPNNYEIDCTITAGTAAETGCSASYPMNTNVTLTATAANDGVSTFGGWGGACAGTMGPTCTVTMSAPESVIAIFNQTGAPIQTGEDSPGQLLDLNFEGGFTSGAGYDANVTLAPGPSFTVQVNAIQGQAASSCTQLVQASFPGAQCFQYSNSTGSINYGPVMFEYTCPYATGGTCGSAANIDFVATLGTDLYFDQAGNPTLYSNTTPYTVIPLPLVGWLKGSGPDPLHPCTAWPSTNPPAPPPPPLFQSNQISSFTDPAGSPSPGNAKGSSGGTGSCWVLTYLTPGEAPTVTVAQPANIDYQQGQVTAAAYTCTTVNEGSTSATGPYLTQNSCTATDSVGGSVAEGGQFDTTTLGPHTFTATVVDSALNTVSQTVTYNVVAATNVAISNSAPGLTTPGSKITYTIGVGDLGPANAVNVVVTDTLAPGTTFSSASGTNIGFPCTTVKGKTTCTVTSTPIACSASNNVVTCPVGTIMPLSLYDLNGAFINITVNVTANGTKQNPISLSNTATVTQSNAETKQDNTATAKTTVN